MVSELRPCPFCGTLPKLVKGTFGYQSMHNGEDNFKIECRDLDCFGPITPLYGTADDAIEAWNRRAKLAPEADTDGIPFT